MKRPAPEPTFGYLETIEDPAHGATGGLLIISATGRPLEFHCTAPVLPSRAQEILFGATLRPHLLGEQIGAALVRRATITPAALVVTDPDLVSGATSAAIATALLPRDGSTTPDAALPNLTKWRPLDDVEPTVWAASDHAMLADALRTLAESVDLGEPFERIREAIREAQRLGQEGSGQEGVDHRDAA